MKSRLRNLNSIVRTANFSIRKPARWTAWRPNWRSGWTPEGERQLETAGVLDSKFGAVTLLRLTANSNVAKACVGFIKRLGDPALQISGWSCHGTGLPARRASIGCMLNRLTLLAASATSADWVMGTGNPRLRGAL